MGRKPEKEVVRWLTLEELNEEIRNRKICTEVLRKLFFIKELYKGTSVPQAAKEVGASKVIGYAWLENWNRKGIEGLKPNYGGGRPSELNEEQKKELETILKKRDEKRDDLTTKEVRELIKDKFGVEYSLRHVSRLLKSMGMKYAKPYQQDYRKPENAEEDLKKT